MPTFDSQILHGKMYFCSLMWVIFEIRSRAELSFSADFLLFFNRLIIFSTRKGRIYIFFSECLSNVFWLLICTVSRIGVRINVCVSVCIISKFNRTLLFWHFFAFRLIFFFCDWPSVRNYWTQIFEFQPFIILSVPRRREIKFLCSLSQMCPIS